MTLYEQYDPDDDQWSAIAAIVDRFEQARCDSAAVDLQDFFPADDCPYYTQAAAEIVRVDMEYWWRDGPGRRLAAYREVAPRLFGDLDSLNQVAFEEFRLRQQSGEQVSPLEYRDVFGVDIHSWPSVIGGDQVARDESLGRDDLPDDNYPQAGDEFAGFQLVREIGRGAFAKVYLAAQNDLARRPVVLKISRRRSLEPEHLARLQHTNIVPIYSVHEADGFVAVCMPFYGEGTLASITRNAASSSTPGAIAEALQSTITGGFDATLDAKPKPRPATDLSEDSESDVETSPPRQKRAATSSTLPAIRLVRDLAVGLSHAHSRGIVHRDLKPANILLADDGRPMLLDFNLSDGAAVNGTASLTIGGTLPYMAPEHLQAVERGGDVGFQADVYSLGVILFELLAARRPFADRTGNFEQLVARCREDRVAPLPSLRSLNPDVPPSIESLVEKCLALSPNDRVQSADDLAEDLTRHLSDLPLKHVKNPSLVEQTAKWRRRHPRLMSASTAGAIGLLIAAVFAGLWMARNNQLAVLAAEQHYSQFREQLPKARLALSLPDSDRSLLEDGLAGVQDVVQMYLSPTTNEWRGAPRFAKLPEAEREQLELELAELCYLQARAESIIASQPVESSEASSLLESALSHNQLAESMIGGESYAIAVQQQTLETLLGRESVPPEALPEAKPKNPIDDYLLAQKLLADRNFSGAAEKLRRLREAHPTDPVVWLLLGSALGGLGQHVDAEGAFSTAAALEPRSDVALLNRANGRLEQRKFSEAIADYEAVLAMHPQLVCALLNRALAYEAMGEWKLALTDLNDAVASQASPPRALLLRARIKKQMGDDAGAEADRQLGIAMEPWDEAGWIARGIAQLASDPQAAWHDFQQALQRNPQSVNALKNIVHVTADRLQRPDDALAALNAWLNLEPNNANALIGCGVLKARLGEREASLADVESALKQSQDPVILFQAACAYSLLAGGDPPNKEWEARGLALLSQAMDRDPRLFPRAFADPDLSSLRKSELFQRLVEAYQELGQLKVDLNNAAMAEDRRDK